MHLSDKKKLIINPLVLETTIRFCFSNFVFSVPKVIQWNQNHAQFTLFIFFGAFGFILNK